MPETERPAHPLAVGTCGCPLYLDTKVVEHREGCPFPPAARQAEAWNDWFGRRHLSVLGAPVRYWTDERTGPGAEGVTRTGAQVLGGHTAVLWVEGVPGAIGLSHVAIVVLVVATILATTAVVAPLTFLFARRPRPMMPHRQRVLLGEAMALIHQFLNPTDLDRPDFLSERSKEAAKGLLTRYNKEINK